MPIIVKAGPQDTNDQVIRKFKKKVQQDQILTQLKEKEFYKKPSEIKKEQRKEADIKRRRSSN
jgi:small subunit ribosomal protein S21